MRKIRRKAAASGACGYSKCSARESGTGKEVLAAPHPQAQRAHRHSESELRSCSCRPAGKRLFGYEPGAFTGATHAKPGNVELCNKGTILLDEIGEMRPPCRPNCCTFTGPAILALGQSLHHQVDGRIWQLPTLTSLRLWPPSGCAKIFTPPEWHSPATAARARTQGRDPDSCETFYEPPWRNNMRARSFRSHHLLERAKANCRAICGAESKF